MRQRRMDCLGAGNVTKLNRQLYQLGLLKRQMTTLRMENRNLNNFQKSIVQKTRENLKMGGIVQIHFTARINECERLIEQYERLLKHSKIQQWEIINIDSFFRKLKKKIRINNENTQAINPLRKVEA